MTKHHVDDGDDASQSEIEIIDLDAVEKMRPSLAANVLQGQRLTKRTRLLLACGTLISCLILLAVLQPQFWLGWTQHSPATPTPTPTANVIHSSHTISAGLFPDGDVLYFYEVDSANYLSHPGTLYAVMKDNGSQIWHYDKNVIHTPYLVNGLLYIPTTNGMDVLTSKTRTLLWHTSDLVSDLVFTSTMVYVEVANTGGRVDALRLTDGVLLWHHNGTDGLLFL